MSPPTPGRRATLALLAALALLVALPSLLAIARGTVAIAGPSDFPHYTIPLVEEYRARAESHEGFPRWSGAQYLGHGLLGDPQDRLLYPPMALYVAVALPAAHHLYLLLHTLVRTLGMYALLRRERCSVAASLLGACMAGLSWKAAAYELSGWDTLAGCNAWLPVALLFWREATTRGRERAVVPFALALALGIYAGTPMLFAFLALGLPFATLGPLLSRRRSTARLRRIAVALAVGFALAFALAAPVLLPALEGNRETTRAVLKESYGLRHELLDSVGALSLPDFTRGDFRWETSDHLGLLALPLAGAGLARRRGRVPFAAWLLLVSLILAAGQATPFGYVVAALPVVGTLSYTTRLLWLASYAVVWLAALGFDALLRVEGRRRRRLTVGLAAGAVALGLGVLFPGRLAKLAPIPPAAVLLGLALAGLAAALPRLPRARRAPVLVVLALATAAELLALTLVVLEPFPWATLAEPGKIRRELEREPLARVAVVTSQFFKDPVWPLYAAGPVERADGYNPLHPRRAAHLLDAISGRDESWAPYTWLAGVARPDLLPLAATHVVSHRPIPGWTVVAEEDLDVLTGMGVTRPGHAVLSRVPGSLPRAFFRARARSVPGERQVDELLAAPFSPGTQLLVDGPVPRELEGESEAGALVPVELVEHAPERVVLRVRAPDPGGWVVLLEGWSSAWRATVDASPAPVRCADGAFRAVQVPGGEHTVEMTLALPGTLGAGCALALAGVLASAGVLGGAAILGRGRRRASP